MLESHYLLIFTNEIILNNNIICSSQGIDYYIHTIQYKNLHMQGVAKKK